MKLANNTLYGTKYSRVDQVNLWKTAFKKYPFNFFKGCLPQILLDSLFNTLSHMKLVISIWRRKKTMSNEAARF